MLSNSEYFVTSAFAFSVPPFSLSRPSRISNIKKFGNMPRFENSKRALLSNLRMEASPPSSSARPSPPATAQPTKRPISPPSLDRVVCKFGGSSLADAARLREVSSIVRMQLEASRLPPIVVLSAMGSSTNELLSAGQNALKKHVDTSIIRSRSHESCKILGLSEELVEPLLDELQGLLDGISLVQELSPRTLDYLVSFGERLSVRIFAAHLRKNEGLSAREVDAFNMGFLTNSRFTNAEIHDSTFLSVKKFVESRPADEIIVVTGFIAKDSEGNITTLGRGGSDLTASVVGASIGVTEVQVWKDVDGIMSTDPRIVPNAIPLPSIAFQEAAELAYFGAKVLHPGAILPAMQKDIPVRVKNSYAPSLPGTVIVAKREVRSEYPVTAISLKKNVELVDVCSTRMLGAYGYLAEVFKTFALHKISVDAVATSEVSISMTLNESEVSEDKRNSLVEDLKSIAKVEFSTGKAIVSLVSNVARSSEIVGRATMALHKKDIEVQMISQGASKFNISFVVQGEQGKMAVQILHNEFFSNKNEVN